MDMLKRGFALLFRRRDFGLLMGAQFFNQAAAGLVQATLAAVIVFGGHKGFDLEGAKSPAELLRTALYTLLPYTFLSPFAGVVIDRWDRRRLMFVANAVSLFAVLAIAIVGTQSANGLPLFVVFLITLIAGRIVLATKAAAIPTILDNDELVEGNAVSQLGGALFQLVGAGVALVAKKHVSAPPVLVVGAIVYAIAAASSIAIARAGEVRVVRTFAQELAHVIRRIVDGIREVARTAKAGAAITTYFWLRFIWSFSLVGIGLEARHLLAGNNTTVTVITGGAGAIGAVLGFVSARRLHQRVRSTASLVVLGALAGGAAVALLGGFSRKSALALLAFGLGFGFFLSKISLDTLVQESLGDEFRGRAFSLYDIAYNLAWVSAAGLMAAFYSPARVGGLIGTIGAAFLVGLGGLAAWFKKAGLLERTVVPASVS